MAEVQHKITYPYKGIAIVLTVSTFLVDSINAFLSDRIESKALLLGVVAIHAKRQALRLPNLIIIVNETTDGADSLLRNFKHRTSLILILII